MYGTVKGEVRNLAEKHEKNKRAKARKGARHESDFH